MKIMKDPEITGPFCIFCNRLVNATAVCCEERAKGLLKEAQKPQNANLH